ncbi:MAG TPA: hypothetical protein VJG32_07210 [Anaerolineae bacterium]|nr:hypothetical protein [Anaerolineae bacterium]
MSETRVPSAIAKIAPDGNLTPRQARHLLIEMSVRKQKPGTGSSLEFLRKRTAMNQWPDLRDVLKGIPWAIIGGVATRAYMPERMTNDLDILVEEARGKEVIHRLKIAGYSVVSQLSLPGYLLRSSEGVEVDVLFGNTPWLSAALRNPRHDPVGYPVLDLPYLVLMKLNAMRTQDWADAARMLGLASEVDLDRVRGVVAHYSPEDAEDLESLIFLGKKEQEIPPLTNS